MSNLKIDNFIKTSLGELVSKEKKSIISGPFGSNIGKVFFKSEGIPVIRGNNLSTGGEKFKDRGFVFITRDKANELNCYAIKNDLIFTAVGTIGQVGIIDEKLKFDEYVISNKQLRVRFDNSIITPLFAYYWFSSYWIQKLIVQRNVGSTVPLINLSILKGLPIILPKSIKVQNNITEILENISAKIELNNKINTELEAMAKTLYDYWFVQFDFPDVDGKPYKTSGGKMVYNAELKRDIPEGWENGGLSDIANITMGQSPPGESYNEEGKGMIFYQGCTDFGNRYPTIRKFTTSPTRFAKQGDILLSVRAPVGTLNISKEDCCIGRGLACMNSKNNAITYLFGVMVNLKQTFDRRNVSGTTFGSITKDDLFSLPVIIPNEKTIRAFQNLVFPAFEKQNKIELENIELASLRDWLLPMLMNGQVSVGDVEEELGMVAEGNVVYKKQ
jgi:type I restriction enzyme S subunit